MAETTEARDGAAPPLETSEEPAAEGSPERRKRRFVGSTPFLVLVALGVAILVKTFFVQAFYIPSESMVPTLEIGDRVFVNKLAGVERGDVIVFESPQDGETVDRGFVGGILHWLGEGIGVAHPENEDYIKRVVGLPGETVEIRDNVVYIDGEVLDEPYLTDGAAACNGEYPPTQLPDDALFVLGDNRCNSGDSRYGLGFIPIDRVIGQAFVIIWPPSDLGGLG